MNRIPIIAGNWKMKLDKSFHQATMPAVLNVTCKIIVAPPSLAVHAVQDVHWEQWRVYGKTFRTKVFIVPLPAVLNVNAKTLKVF